jgi:hypothetical protein
MWANRLSEMDDVAVAAVAQINYMDSAPVGAWFAYAGISVDGNVTEAMVGRHGDFVAINIDADFADHFSRIEIHDERGVVSLIRDKKKSVRSRRFSSREHRITQEKTARN